MSTAVYPGSFDPITLGHLDLIRRAAKIFDRIIVLVSHSERKTYLLSPDERKSLIVESVTGIKNVEINIWDGLTTDYVKKVGSKIILRGVRSSSDFDNEIVIAQMNKKLTDEIETCVLFPSPEYQFISSSAIKEVARAGGNLEPFVPLNVMKALKAKYNAIKKN